MQIPVTTDAKATVSIDLDAIKPSHRLDFWNDIICRHYSPSHNSTTLPPKAFSATMKSRKMGRMDISHIKSVALTSIRDKQSLRTDPLDCFFVSMMIDGEARITQSGRTSLQKAGDFILYDSAQPFKYEMLSNYTALWMRLPRNLVATRMANPEALTARRLSGNSGVGRLAQTMLQEAMSLDISGSEPAASRISNSLLDVLAATFEVGSNLSDTQSTHQVNLLDRAKSFMLTNLDDAELDIETIVDTVGVSRRTLNRLFANEHTSPIRWLWQQRLERARLMLEEGQENRVTSVAVACGFSDFSHFSRAFKTQFGMPPKALLKQTLN